MSQPPWNKESAGVTIVTTAGHHGDLADAGARRTAPTDSDLAQQVAALIRINTEDMLESIGLHRVERGRRFLEWLCYPAARRFAHEIATFDRAVGAHGLREGSTWLLERCVGRVEVAGQEHVPASGPLLVVANHPGAADTIALFASLPRTDLRIVAADRPFLRALTHVSRSLIVLGDTAADRRSTVREIVGHLRAGGTILTFPAGQIEPDPAVLPGAVASLAKWSESIGLLVRLVPETAVVPAIVSGVLSAAAQRNPITRLRHRQEDRERLGAMLQVIVPAYRAVDVRIAYGAALPGSTLLAGGQDATGVTRQIVAGARRILESPPSAWTTLLDFRG